jgi:D-arabinose 1-dehydrogenase-like Zn-dependent alcohol dehydrogenase
MTGKTVLVWGGASSVGCNAIQLIRAAGYEVIATASPRNFGYLKSLGASHVIDYNSSSATEDIVASFEGRESAGAIACVPDTVESCAAVLRRVTGRKFIASAGFLPKDSPNDVEAQVIISNIFVKDPELSSAIMEHYLPRALADGEYLAAPPPHVVGRGLENVQTALDLASKGVSAQKLVVSL